MLIAVYIVIPLMFGFLGPSIATCNCLMCVMAAYPSKTQLLQHISHWASPSINSHKGKVLRKKKQQLIDNTYHAKIGSIFTMLLSSL